MSWGWKIVVIYTGFVVMTLAMVFYFMGEKVDLVADDYYKQEIAYQDQIDKMSNTQALEQPLTLDFDRNTHSASLQFPSNQVSTGLKGTIHLYRPANSSEDKVIDVLTDTSGIQVISLEGFSRGLWKIKVNWNSGGKEFYIEKILTL